MTTAPTALARSRVDVDAINIALMIGSGLLAFVAPVQLFLFSYAVLGPLHYLTEIGWLHQRAYFLHHRWHAGALVALGLAGTAINERWVRTGSVAATIGEHSAAIAVGIGAGLLASRRHVIAIPAAIAGYLAVVAARSWSDYRFWLLYLLPTLVHVFVFTVFFVVSGAVRSRSRLGVVSVFVLIGAAATTWTLRPGSIVGPTGYAADAYSSFAGLNQVVLSRLGESGGSAAGLLDNVIGSPVGLALMRFIAFAYTYHYLNWFSKTRVINWHRVPKVQLAVVVVLWIASLVVYAIDYALGMRVLFFLSFVHVLLELPLNVRTIAGLPAACVARRV